MKNPVRITYATTAVLQALSGNCAYGFDIAAATGLRRGTVYPILRRLEEAQLVEARWEEVGKFQDEGRPARRYYRLNDDGRALARTAGERFPAAALALSIGLDK